MCLAGQSPRGKSLPSGALPDREADESALKTIPVVTRWDWREQKGQSGTNRWAGPQEGVADSQQVAEQMEEKYGHGQVGRAPAGAGAMGQQAAAL